MSIQAMTWALEQKKVTNPTSRHVLLCLANYAGSDGRAAFPSVSTLMNDTGLSERCIRSHLEELEKIGAIKRGNQAIAAAYISRIDRRPVVYDIPLTPGESGHRESQERGAVDAPRKHNGVHLTHERGAGGAPNPSTIRKQPPSSLRSDGDASVAQAVMLNDSEIEEPSLQTAIFEIGLPIILQAGGKEKSARSLLGKLRKELGDLDALVTVEAMAKENPFVPAEWLSAKIKSRARIGNTFSEWMDVCRRNGEPLISNYQPLLNYCESVKLPTEFMNLAWAEYKRQHLPGGIYAEKLSEDWRESFRIAIERNFLRLWFIDTATGEYSLTTVGMQARNLFQAQPRITA